MLCCSREGSHSAAAVWRARCNQLKHRNPSLFVLSVILSLPLSRAMLPFREERCHTTLRGPGGAEVQRACDGDGTGLGSSTLTRRARLKCKTLTSQIQRSAIGVKSWRSLAETSSTCHRSADLPAPQVHTYVMLIVLQCLLRWSFGPGLHCHASETRILCEHHGMAGGGKLSIKSREGGIDGDNGHACLVRWKSGMGGETAGES